MTELETQLYEALIDVVDQLNEQIVNGAPATSIKLQQAGAARFAFEEARRPEPPADKLNGAPRWWVLNQDVLEQALTESAEGRDVSEIIHDLELESDTEWVPGESDADG